MRWLLAIPIALAIMVFWLWMLGSEERDFLIRWEDDETK